MYLIRKITKTPNGNREIGKWRDTKEEHKKQPYTMLEEKGIKDEFQKRR